MPQIINTNVASLNAQRNLDKSQAAQETALQRLSSGLRINSAKDDAAGIAISTRIDSQVRGLNVASRNAGDGVSLAQVAEGSLDSITTNLQRLREIAVQSSNATNSSVDRASLNEEAQQIIEEIGRTSESASFNGVKLLDGSFQAASFQVGANVGETVDVSIGKIGVDTLGSAATAGISAVQSGTPILDNAAAGADSALVAGDLVLNGVAVQASDATNDTASNALAGSSAIAKAAAINAASDLTGVTATANANTVEGTNLAAVTGDTGIAVTINGVALTFATATTTDLTGTQAELGKVADEINSVQGATGVVATVVSTNTGYRVDLTAEDGRNIDVLDGTAGDAASVGIAAGAATNANTYLGSVTLASTDGSDITISTTSGNIDNSGLEEGTFSGRNGGLVSDNSTDAARLALASGDLLVNGTNVGVTLAADDTSSTAVNAVSSIALAAAINRVSDTTGVTAEANQNTLYSAAVVANASVALTINDVTINAGAGGTATVGEQLTNVIDAINSKAGQTGVRAEALDGDQYKLIAEDGRNIEIGGVITGTGLTVDNYIGGVTLESAGEFTLSSDTGAIESAGLRVGTYGGSESGTLLQDVDISTAAGATAAIDAVDNALASVNSQRATLGAIQSRFENVISANQLSSENLSASNSRIRDADFAAETAALSRSQVLQQAGISVLAQANARPQQVLSLLQ